MSRAQIFRKKTHPVAITKHRVSNQTMEERIAAAEAEVSNPMATKAMEFLTSTFEIFVRISIVVIFRGEIWQSICFECS